jgi:hypothetical protein
MRSAHPTRPRETPFRGLAQMIDRLLIARRQKTREHRTIRKSNTQRKLLHDQS